MTKIVFLTGPTAVGKTDLAIELAEAFAGEIIGADSRQLYRGLDIGTAKPTHAQRARIPHHLIDVAEPDEPFTLARYLPLVRAAIADVAARGRVPFVVGGTGQYLWALLRGHRPPAVVPDPDLRQRLEALAHSEGTEALYAELAQLDPLLAGRTDRLNPRRLIRAIEVAMARSESEGVQGLAPLAPAHAEPVEASPSADDLEEALVLGLTLPREHLYARADARIESMLAAGWVEEVRDLLSRHGDPRRLPAFAALGYRQLVTHLAGEASLAESVQRAKFETHRFIRQQYAWFRRPDFGTRWLDVEDQAASKEALGAAITGFLGARSMGKGAHSIEDAGMVYSTPLAAMSRS